MYVCRYTRTAESHIYIYICVCVCVCVCVCLCIYLYTDRAAATNSTTSYIGRKYHRHLSIIKPPNKCIICLTTLSVANYIASNDKTQSESPSENI